MSETTPIVLSCPNCGSKLEITPDIERFVCLHCGTQQIVRRGGGLITLQPLMQAIERVQYGTDRTAAELAIKRLTGEISQVQKELDWWKKALPDDVLPPTSSEKMLLILMLIAFLGGTAISAPELGILGVIFLFLHVYARRQRTAEAKEKTASELEMWSAKMKKLQDELETNRRTVIT